MLVQIEHYSMEGGLACQPTRTLDDSYRRLFLRHFAGDDKYLCFAR